LAQKKEGMEKCDVNSYSKQCGNAKKKVKDKKMTNPKFL